MKACGLLPIHIHGLRISSATLAYIDNISNPFVEHLITKKLNHKNFTTSQGYIQMGKEILEQASGGKVDNGLTWLEEDEEKEAA